MLSTPTPARPITRSFLACDNSAASACTAERTINASADSSCSVSLPLSWSAVSTTQPGSFSCSTAEAEIFSAMTIFTVLFYPSSRFRLSPGQNVDRKLTPR